MTYLLSIFKSTVPSWDDPNAADFYTNVPSFGEKRAMDESLPPPPPPDVTLSIIDLLIYRFVFYQAPMSYSGVPDDLPPPPPEAMGNDAQDELNEFFSEVSGLFVH